MKEGDGAPGQHPFNGHGREQRKGAGRWKAATRQEGVERERERERERGRGGDRWGPDTVEGGGG
jgi:hypothetical protein